MPDHLFLFLSVCSLSAITWGLTCYGSASSAG